MPRVIYIPAREPDINITQPTPEVMYPPIKYHSDIPKQWNWIRGLVGDDYERLAMSYGKTPGIAYWLVMDDDFRDQTDYPNYNAELLLREYTEEDQAYVSYNAVLVATKSGTSKVLVDVPKEMVDVVSEVIKQQVKWPHTGIVDLGD